jgi:hypothetical protein
VNHFRHRLDTMPEASAVLPFLLSLLALGGAYLVVAVAAALACAARRPE